MTLAHDTKAAADRLLAEHLRRSHVHTDHLFGVLMAVQWATAVVAALFLSPLAWSGRSSHVHIHVWGAIALGGALAVPSMWLAFVHPGARLTRNVVAACQVLFSTLFVHLSGGRIETHFHVFGSLAFIAFYRDWRLLVPATLIVAVDHLLRGIFWPQSVFGIISPSPWRALEHAGWVIFEDVILAYSCVQGVRQLRVMATAQAHVELASARTEAEVVARTRQLVEAQNAAHSERAILSNVMAHIPFLVYWKDRNSRYVGCNEAFARAVHFPVGEVTGRSDHDFVAPALAEVYQQEDAEVLATGRPKLNFERTLQREQVTTHYLASKVSLRNERGEVIGVLGISADVTERKAMEASLAQSQKLESIGQLAAGIAHEINTPVQYVSDNMRFLRDQFHAILKVVESYEMQLDPEHGSRTWQERRAEVSRNLKELDFDFVRCEVPQALSQSLDGLERVTTIVRAMKEFSHPGGTAFEAVDLNRAIASTATVCTNRWKYVADLQLDLDPKLPPVVCMVAELNQVILNLIVNAADAIGDHRAAGSGKGHITVRTRAMGDHVEIRVVDDGGGIPPSVQGKLFAPFFTTKGVGKGTGQGLAISQNIIVRKHGGTIRFETIPGTGTTFIVTVPVVQAAADQVKEAA